jgi:hypothetical protein
MQQTTSGEHGCRIITSCSVMQQQQEGTRGAMRAQAGDTTRCHMETKPILCKCAEPPTPNSRDVQESPRRSTLHLRCVCVCCVCCHCCVCCASVCVKRVERVPTTCAVVEHPPASASTLSPRLSVPNLSQIRLQFGSNSTGGTRERVT